MKVTAGVGAAIALSFVLVFLNAFLVMVVLGASGLGHVCGVSWNYAHSLGLTVVASLLVNSSRVTHDPE